jgi:catechol 2,3-dioxygenase-like lactoylglutathione lyase family enzyme
LSELPVALGAAASPSNSSSHFHVTLCVADLARSVRFYECLFGCLPTMQHGHYARFEIQRPALVFVLSASPRPAGGTLNHVGLRLGSSAELAALQRRLETAGISTQSQEGVACCYSRQTKFWVTSPDGVLWELYILEGDLDHSGFDDAPVAKAAPAAQATWTHRLTDPLPDRIPFVDASLDEVRCEGTFNVPLAAAQQAALLAEARRVLRPGGRIVLHALLGDRPFPGEPRLPGLAALVRHVPVEGELADAMQRAGFEAVFFETLSDVNCIRADGVDLRHGLVVGLRPDGDCNAKDCYVLYRGPLAQVRDEQGVSYPRGQKVAVSAASAERLKHGPAADQFAFLPAEQSKLSLPMAAGCCNC